MAAEIPIEGLSAAFIAWKADSASDFFTGIGYDL